MDDYSTYQGALEIFRKVNCVGEVENCIFGGIVALTKSERFKAAAIGKTVLGPAGFTVGNAIGRERDLSVSKIYEYAHVLFDFTENGVGIMPLAGSKVTINPQKSQPDYDGFIWFNYKELSNISIKKYYKVRNKIKIITITLADNNKLHFYAKMVEKTLPYQEHNMNLFVGRYQK